MSDYVTIQELANEVGLDRSSLRRYIKKQGFNPVKVRTPETRGQLTLAFTPEEAETIVEMRQSEGFLVGGDRCMVTTNGTDGFFYVIQVIPEFAPNRIKLGFAGNVQTRLSAHRTSAPTAVIVESWCCRRNWEYAAMDSITRTGCYRIANEVFECDDLDELVQRANDFFVLMPEQQTTPKR